MCDKNTALFRPPALHPFPLFGLGTPATSITPTTSTTVTMNVAYCFYKVTSFQILGGVLDMDTLGSLGTFTGFLKVNMEM